MTDHTGNAAAVVIPYSDKREKFLVAKRTDNGEWESPGGKFKNSSNQFEAAKREIEEETLSSTRKND